MSALAPCPSCQRHHFVDETQCPFCGHERAPPARGRLLAAAAVGVALATGVVACGGETVPIYGIPVMEDGGTRTSTDAGS